MLTIANPANANAIAQVLAPQIARAAAGYTHVFGPSTTTGKDLMPAVAALLGVNQVSDLMAVDGPCCRIDRETRLRVEASAAA